MPDLPDLTASAALVDDHFCSYSTFFRRRKSLRVNRNFLSCLLQEARRRQADHSTAQNCDLFLSGLPHFFGRQLRRSP